MAMLVEGYAAIFGIPDKSGDTIVRGAFSQWIASTGGELVLPVYWHHEHSPKVGGNPTRLPVGATTLVAQRERGLYFRAQLAGFPKAEALAELLQLGAARGASIGYNVYKGGAARVRGGRELTALHVGEISITPTGRAMHPLAFVQPASAGLESAEQASPGEVAA